MRKLWLAALLVTGLARAGFSQAVRGSVVAEGAGPVSGVVVALLDSAGRDVARSLTNERGEYRLVAPRPGTYRIRTLRIGFRSRVSEPIALRAGDDLVRPLSVSTIAFALDTVRAQDRNSCRIVARDSASTIFAVWEQVRNALLAMNLSGGDRTVRATTMGYAQMLDPVRGRVATQTADVRTDFLRQPWRSLSPDSIRRSGYVVTEAGDVRTYHAPGIDVLLSEEFLSDHCLRIDPRSDARRLGIAFEPTPEREKVAEIRGTLWLDRASTELRRLEYRYVNVSRVEERVAGGDMSFVRMRNGMWAISKWNIRMPTIVLVPVYNNLIYTGQEQRIDSIKVEGGEIVAVVATGRVNRDTLWSRPPVILSGTIIDSVSGSPVRGAMVSLPAAKRADTTDARGRFTLRDMLPGRYALEVRTPSLDSVQLAHEVPVLFTDSSSAVEVRVPNAGQILNAVCPDIDIRQRSQRVGILVGAVSVSGDTTPRAGIRVIARWNTVEMNGPITDRPPRGDEGYLTRLPNVTSERRLNDTRTDADGVYRLCGVPTLTNIVVQAVVDSSTQGFRRVRLGDSHRLVRLDFAIDPGKSSTATFSGIVQDSAGAPLTDSEIQLPELGLSTRTDKRGAFRIAGIIPGTQNVLVRKPGFGPLDAPVEFAPGLETDRRIVLSRAALQLDTVRTIENTLWREAPLLREFEENRKIGLGKFFTRADLDKARGRSMVSFFEGPGYKSVVLDGGRWIKSTRLTSINPHCYELEDQFGALPPGVNCGCFPLVFLDAHPLSDSRRVPNINRFRPDDLEAVEFYRGGAETPQRYSLLNSECGVIVLHSRRPDVKK